MVVSALANRGTEGVNEMAKETGPFQASTGMAEEIIEQITKQIQETMVNYFGWLQNNMSASTWGMSYATENVIAAFTFVRKLSQAKDLQDVVTIQTEFVQMQVDMFNERAKELSDAIAAARNVVAAFVSLLHYRKLLDEMARNSPTYRQTGGEGRNRNWSAVP
jgi:hypothetical protein